MQFLWIEKHRNSPKVPNNIDVKIYIGIRIATLMAGHFEVYLDAAKKYRFKLKASNGEVIATGEGYNSKTACMEGIESIKKNAPIAAVKDLTLNK